MIDNVVKARQWLDVLARGALAEWGPLVTDDFTLHAVAMPGGDTPVTGREVNRERVGKVWHMWQHFSFEDVDAHATADDPDLVFVTARSEATTVWGASYTNQYVLRLRFQDGLLHEHLEFFDPAPVLELLNSQVS
jgi:ketosteroid isomerase-like protein